MYIDIFSLNLSFLLSGKKMVCFTRTTQVYKHHDFIDLFLQNREPDCFLYSNDGMKFDIHKEIFYHSEWMRNIFIDTKDTCCREMEIFCPCSSDELDIITKFLYSGTNSLNDEIEVSNITNVLTKIFGFSGDHFYFDEESKLSKPEIWKIKEEADQDLNDETTELEEICIPLNPDTDILIKSEPDPLIYNYNEEKR